MTHCVFWLCAGLAFNLAVWASMGADLAAAWLSGYSLEWLLSIDSIFVFLAVFKAHGTPQDARRTALCLAILGALLMRAVFFWLGVALVGATPVQAVMGVALIFSGCSAAAADGAGGDLAQAFCAPGIGKCLSSAGACDPRGAVFAQGCRGTKLLLVVLVLQVVDVIFAADSVLAKLAVHRGVFINFTSSAFALACLNSLYYVLENAVAEFRFLKYAVASILALVGMKAIVKRWFAVGQAASLAVIFVVMSATIALSVLRLGAVSSPRRVQSSSTREVAVEGVVEPLEVAERPSD